MTEITFGRLQDLPPREAWAHEAHAFTPWLAQNIDQLSEAIGMPLELTGQEVRVETFAADILARNPQDDTVVLIENQLEATDHTHLGQIMTYLAGLEAHTVVWIAPNFREPHLSAVRWLNEHTAEGFAFFAVRLRVVRIADSPYAPVFEVVEKPNDWERRLTATTRRVTGENPIHAPRRQAFWTMFLDKHPDLADHGIKAGDYSNHWIKTDMPEVIVGVYVASRTCGIYVRGALSKPIADLTDRLGPFADDLERSLGTPFAGGPNEPNWLLVSSIGYPLSDEEHWPDIVEWMADRLRLYLKTLSDIAPKAAP